MPTTLPEAVPLTWLAFAGGSGVVLGLVLGLVIGWVARIKLKARLEARDAELAARSDADSERERALSIAAERLRATFDELADQQFRSHSETFLKLARENLSVHHERAKGDLAAREQAIENLVRPIREALQRTDAQIHELEKARRETHGSLQTQLEAMAASHTALSVETRNLVNALRRPEVRGQWGEITLRRLVELAGMVEHCDFTTQAHQTTETGSVRPDLVINLPEGRQLVVDVKTPLDAYLEAVQAENETDRRSASARHASIVAERVRELAAKAYWSQFERSPEFVILFIPGDQFLSAALSQRPALLDEALRQNIILATPTSFVALLKAVAYGWQQVQLAENAAEIRSLGTQLYERLNTFAGHLAQVGKSLGDSVKAYNRGVGSLERMVLPGARRFTELGVRPRQEIPPLRTIEELPRDASATEADAPEGIGDSLRPETQPEGEPLEVDAPSPEAVSSAGVDGGSPMEDDATGRAGVSPDNDEADAGDTPGSGAAPSGSDDSTRSAKPADDDDEASQADRLAVATHRD